jgi:hypothetical protein
MPHVLAQARSAAVAALNGLPTTGPRVYVQEPYPWPEASLPALVVATSCAPVPEYLDPGAALRWDVVIEVTCVVKGTGDLMAELDTIATEVQGALCALATVGGKSVQVLPTNLDAPAVDGSGDQPVARRTVSLVMQSLFTLAASPDLLLD